MSKDYLSLGPTPAAESCAQVGAEDYHKQSKAEIAAYIGQLNRVFGDKMPPGCRFSGKAFPHDFGTYHEVVVWFDPDSEDESNFAYSCENNMPQEWDAEARKELGLS